MPNPKLLAFVLIMRRVKQEHYFLGIIFPKQSFILFGTRSSILMMFRCLLKHLRNGLLQVSTISYIFLNQWLRIMQFCLPLVESQAAGAQRDQDEGLSVVHSLMILRQNCVRSYFQQILAVLTSAQIFTILLLLGICSSSLMTPVSLILVFCQSCPFPLQIQTIH